MKIYDILFGPREKSISLIIEEGNLDELKSFIANGADVNGRYDGKSLLHFAIDNCENNYFEVIEFLINSGADINSCQSYLQETPLHRVCARINPKMDVVELLLDRGAKTNPENIAGKTPVFYCNFSYSVELLNLLVKHRANINHTDKYKNTILHDDYLNYTTGTFEEFLKVLISLGFDVNSRNNLGHTPLYLCKNKYIEKILTENGAEI
ncbi:ankyrin repeat protein [Clostridium puniceum]|uniref:Ankyrin repeat protein n=1 Tax=Clostridium puniceum TaxID=29367 RepID=A0A1S8TKN1_9CLOT|nr:ankyrin repeat domain-containing protein [Clostridium puniceum]OOM78159.1 ankyrin repeat protein [Clostridium puniceum]